MTPSRPPADRKGTEGRRLRSLEKCRASSFLSGRGLVVVSVWTISAMPLGGRTDASKKEHDAERDDSAVSLP